MTKFMVGTIQIGDGTRESSRKHHHLELVSELSQVEYENLVDALKTINAYLRDSQLFMIVVWNFREFTELLDNYLKAYANKDFNTFTQKPIPINVNRTFLNLLSSIRSYLDFMERLLKKGYGEESAIFRNFKKNCSTEYDSNFAYRFLYNLRHYAQHKGFPISNIAWGQKPSSENPPKAIYFLEVSIARDEILNNFDWRALEGEIKKLPETIEILPLASKFMQSLSRVHESVITDMFQTLNDSARQIVIIGEKLAGHQGEPAIFEFEGDVRNMRQLRHQPFPIELAQQILRGNLLDT